jgi:hypothetical protein
MDVMPPGVFGSRLARWVSLCLLAGLVLPSASAAPLAEPSHERIVRVQRLAHYCDWLQKCATGRDCDWWWQASTIPFRRDALPGIGYASMDPAIIRDQNRELWTNGIVPLISWWGPNEPRGGSAFFDLYLAQWDPQYPVKPGILYEILGRLKVVNGVVDFADPDNAQRFVSDMRYLHERFWSRYPDRFYRFNARPLLFIWLTEIIRGPFAEVVARAQREVPFSVIGSDVTIPPYLRPGLEANVRAMDAVSHYGIYSPPMALAHGGHVDESYTGQYAWSIQEWSSWLAQHAPDTRLILPLQFSFDDHLVPGRANPSLTSTPEEARRLASTARGLIQESLSSCGNLAPLVLVVSYNEHFEGSAIEPNDRYGDDFLEILRQTFAAPLTRSIDCP